MTERRIAMLAIRMFGLFVAFEGLHDLLRGAEFAAPRGLDALTSSGLISAVLLIAVGAVIWMNADDIAARALDETVEPEAGEDAAPTPPVRVNLSALNLNSIAFSVLGIYLIAQALVAGSNALGLWIQALRPPTATNADAVGFTDFSFGEARTRAVTAAAYLVAGLILALGARGLAAMFKNVWWKGQGIVRANRLELVDFEGTVRAELAIEETTGGRDDAGLTFFDEGEHPRLSAGTYGGYAPQLVFSDETGREVLRLPSE